MFQRFLCSLRCVLSSSSSLHVDRLGHEADCCYHCITLWACICSSRNGGLYPGRPIPLCLSARRGALAGMAALLPPAETLAYGPTGSA